MPDTVIKAAVNDAIEECCQAVCHACRQHARNQVARAHDGVPTHQIYGPSERWEQGWGHRLEVGETNPTMVGCEAYLIRCWFEDRNRVGEVVCAFPEHHPKESDYA